MATVKIEILNKKNEPVVYRSVEITTRHYRDFLQMNADIEKESSEVEKLNKQLDFIASLFDKVTIDMLLDQTDMTQIYEIFSTLYSHLVGSVDPKPNN